MDAFLEAKNRVDEINMPEKYKAVFCEMMDDFSAFIKSHEQIKLDFKAVFDKFLYNNLRVEIDDKKIKEYGILGKFSDDENKITLPDCDVSKGLLKNIFMHEFVHFIYHNAYTWEKQLDLWADEMLTELTARKVCNSGECGSYDSLVAFSEFLNSYLPAVEKNIRADVTSFLNGDFAKYMNNYNFRAYFAETLDAYASNSYLDYANNLNYIAMHLVRQKVLLSDVKSGLTREKLDDIMGIVSCPIEFSSTECARDMMKQIDSSIIPNCYHTYEDKMLLDLIAGYLLFSKQNKKEKLSGIVACANRENMLDKIWERIKQYYPMHLEISKTMNQNMRGMQCVPSTSAYFDTKLKVLDIIIQESAQKEFFIVKMNKPLQEKFDKCARGDTVYNWEIKPSLKNKVKCFNRKVAQDIATKLKDGEQVLICACGNKPCAVLGKKGGEIELTLLSKLYYVSTNASKKILDLELKHAQAECALKCAN